MRQHRKHHVYYYCILSCMFLLGFISLFAASYSRQVQMLVIVMMGFSYSVIGIFHHLAHHDINSKIVIEYVLIGVFGIAVALFFLRGGF